MQESLRRRVFLSIFYFFNASGLGLFGPYWGLYLVSLKYSALQIGAITALPALANIISPGIAGFVADKRKKRADMIQLLSAACLILFAISLVDKEFIWQFPSLFTVFLAFTAITPLLETITLESLHGKTHQYGKIRVWGTIGFLMMTLLGGYLTESFSIHLLPYLLFVSFSCVLFSAFFIKDNPPLPVPPSSVKEKYSFWEITKKKQIIILFGSCFCIVCAHGVYGAFYSIHLMEQGYSKVIIGWMWMGAAVSEALCFLLSSFFIKKFDVKRVYIFSFFVAAFRFIMIGWFGDTLWVLSLLQLLHGFTFSMHHAASMVFLERFYPATMLSRAQGVYWGGPYGLGAALGGLMAGAFWSTIAGIGAFTLAGGLVLLGLLIAFNIPAIKHTQLS